MEVPPQLAPAEIAALLSAEAQVIRVEVLALTPELRRWQPDDDEWCASQVLGHLTESERRGFNGRIRRILAEEQPALPGWDQVTVAAARNDRDKNCIDVLEEFEKLREDSLELIRGLTPEQLDRWGTHAQVGEMSVRDLLHEWVHHDRNHVKQLFSISQTAVWPHMGNCRRFAEID
ncbi:MAG: DinB family protein [Dehalococcoidia bacterium]